MKKTLSVLLAALLVFVCAVTAFAADKTQSVYSSYLIPTGSVRMTAHRGYSAAAPENTLPAFRLAGEYGFWGAECDTSPTSDGVWIIMHDDTVDRMTDGEGKVADHTYEEICEMTVDAGNNIELYPGTKVPTLSEYLDVCKEYGLHPVIEIKTCARVEDMDSLASLLTAREEADMFTVITFGAEHAARIKELMPATPVYLLLGGGVPADFDNAVRFCAEHGLDGLDLSCTWGKKQVRAAQKAGLQTMVWTVDATDVAEQYYRWGVRDFTTNSLTPTAPQGNLFERCIWKIRDFIYGLQTLGDAFFASIDTDC